MCLYIINKNEYDKLQKIHSFLTPSDEIFSSLNVDLIDFDISDNGIAGFGTPIIPIAAMFLLIEAAMCLMFLNDQMDQFIISQNIL